MPRRIRAFSPPAFEPALSRSARKAQGVYYTPPEIVQQIIDLTISPLLRDHNRDARSLRILDPSCGAGEFLVAALECLVDSVGAIVARQRLWGMDVDASAVQTARSRLLAVDPQFPTEQIIVGDTLRARNLTTGSFDAIIGNPPYVNIRQLSKSLSSNEVEALRQSYSTARGNFDLYVLFIERAIELLRPGGRCGFIVPGKWATLDYARECRRLLLSKTTIEHVVDLSAAKVFAAANVYPHVLIFSKIITKSSHAVKVSGIGNSKPLEVPQASLSDQAIQLSPPLDVESRISSAPLGSVATIRCGTAGYVAQAIARRLVDVSDNKPAAHLDTADFITSGNIDRYQIHLGNVRYLNRCYAWPRLPLTTPELTSAKRQLFASPKIVVAGMSRRLEAAWDSKGVALGVQVYAASNILVDPFYLLALLNSKLLSYLFATRFAAKRLGGGYLAINKGQLTKLPIRVVNTGNGADARRARTLTQLSSDWSPAHDRLIDRLIYELFGLTDAEIARVEEHFVEPVPRAA